MNWLDVFIAAFLIASLIRGFEVGFVRQFFSTAGFFAGLLLGVWLQGLFIHLVKSAEAKALLVLCLVMGFGMTFMTIGEYIGLRLKLKIKESNLTEKFDRVFGSALAVVTLLAAVWLGAAIFRNLPFDSWRRQITGSRIISTLESTLPSAPDVLTNISHLIDPNGFPQVFSNLEPKLPADRPLPDMGELNEAVRTVRPSVVKIEGEGCGGIVLGSGFIASPGLVVTNAHVIAGVKQPFVVDQQGQHQATPVWFDPDLDLAILRTKELKGAPLQMLADRAADGTPVATAGYPGDKGFTAGPGVVLESFTAYGMDIYNKRETARDIYSVKATVEQGNSGGPLITKDGQVAGVIFAKSYSYSDVGYALATAEVAKALASSKSITKTTSTGACTAD